MVQHRIVAGLVGDGPARQAVGLNPHPVGVAFPAGHLIFEYQSRRSRTAPIARRPQAAAEFELQPRPPRYLHRLAEGHRHLDVIIGGVGPVRPRIRGDRNRAHGGRPGVYREGLARLQVAVVHTVHHRTRRHRHRHLILNAGLRRDVEGVALPRAREVRPCAVGHLDLIGCQPRHRLREGDRHREPVLRRMGRTARDRHHGRACGPGGDDMRCGNFRQHGSVSGADAARGAGLAGNRGEGNRAGARGSQGEEIGVGRVSSHYVRPLTLCDCRAPGR